MRRLTGIVAAIALAVPSVIAGAPVASAQTAGWAQWESLSGGGGDYTTTMQLPAGGFPAAAVTSDSMGGGGVGVISGASTWLSEDTPPGAVYGSSRDRRYLNLRPRANQADTPSTTTYSFERPTPAGGWAFVLGDIDADAVTVTARGPDGDLLTTDELGFQDVFNYCDAAGSPSCTGGDLPTWDPGTSTLTGNENALDTAGAAGWFQPTAPIATLTFIFHRRAGFPVYQTWFASLAREIAGTITGPPGVPLDETTVTLYGPDGTELATTTPNADGTYSFGDYTASDGYEVEITPPPGYIMDETAGDAGQRRRTADLSDADDLDVDFTLREIVPVAVNGTVSDDEGNPIGGVEVTLIGDDGSTITAVTDGDGTYLFDRIEPGDYEFAITTPDGYTLITAPDPITVPEDSEDPLTDNDFVITELPTVSGAVTAGGDPVEGVPVTITFPDGSTDSTLTRPDGTYEFPGLPPGDYTIDIEVPDGYEADTPTSRTVTVADEDVPGVDFALVNPGAIGGIVVDRDGNPVPGVTIEISSPDGSTITLETGDDGSYFHDGLPSGDYGIRIIPPDGYDVDGEQTVTVSITDAGENHLDVDFSLVEAEEPPPGGDDGGAEGGAEAGTDSGTDDGSDAGTDGGADDGTDAGTDGGADGTDDGTGAGTGDGTETGADAGTGTDGSGDELPDTGTPLAPLIGIAILLLATGATVRMRTTAT